jgi:hypothetical protein
MSVIDFPDLLPGDILLFRSFDQARMQQRISAETGSPYTHAAIYLGNNEIAESNPGQGVPIQTLSEDDKQNQVIGVLRSQTGFLHDRAANLRSFVDELAEQGAKYDFQGARSFKERHDAFAEGLLKHLADNYGVVTPSGEFAKRAYLCSALIVACYIVCGVIGDTAEAAYHPDVFSAGDLHRDPTFGWFLGYITNEPHRIGPDDPLSALTRWADHQDDRWW